MLKGIVAISGQPGLFKVISEAKNSVIVESLLNGKRMPAYSTSKISSLADIAVFTQTEEISLKEVLKNIDKLAEGGKSFDPKASGEELKACFEEILPEYDRDKVYVSDMKKIISWYLLLKEKDLFDLTDEEEKPAQEKE
ncbi:MAG: DUF5606 domain-containing protein [Prolixibacteraceae bacterium]|jgi:hypothetical protein|nr:DUF5606 domain-containing protein [Prolixibacteraceae bacterium]